MEDKQLVNEFLTSRSERAFTRLYRAKTPRLYRMAMRLTQDVHESDEIIQQMWMIAIQKLPLFEWRSTLNTWLTSILINLYRSEQKKNSREISTDTSDLLKNEKGTDTPVITTSDMEKAIATLPPGYRKIILLHDLEGYTHKEIAEILDISEGTSKSQLFHARRTLRQYFIKDNVKGSML